MSGSVIMLTMGCILVQCRELQIALAMACIKYTQATTCSLSNCTCYVGTHKHETFRKYM